MAYVVKPLPGPKDQALTPDPCKTLAKIACSPVVQNLFGDVQGIIYSSLGLRCACSCCACMTWLWCIQGIKVF